MGTNHGTRVLHGILLHFYGYAILLYFSNYGSFYRNCFKTIKEFVTNGYKSKILPLPVSLL